MILAGSVVGLAGYAFAGGANSTPAPDRSQAIAPEAVARRREDEEGDGIPQPPDMPEQPVQVAEVLPHSEPDDGSKYVTLPALEGDSGTTSGSDEISAKEKFKKEFIENYIKNDKEGDINFRKAGSVAEASTGPSIYSTKGILTDGLKKLFNKDSSTDTVIKRDGKESGDQSVSKIHLSEPQISELKKSIIDDHKIDASFKGNNGYLTQKKLLLLEMSGVDPKEIKAINDEIVKLRNGNKDWYLGKTPKENNNIIHILSEYRRVIEGRPLERTDGLPIPKSTEDALSRVNLADRVIFKSKSDYVKSIGEGLHSATIGMTFNQKEMNNHVAKIGEVLADTLKKAGITYGNSVKDSNGNSDITPMNLIDKDGFKMPDSKQTDCNRFLAGVLYSAGLFPASVLFQFKSRCIFIT
jgi:hypothetical protein